MLDVLVTAGRDHRFHIVGNDAIDGLDFALGERIKIETLCRAQLNKRRKGPAAGIEKGIYLPIGETLSALT